MDIYTAGAWRSLTSGEVYVDGAWRRLSRVEVYNGAWKTADKFLLPVSASASPAEPNVSAWSSGSATLTTSTTVTPSGGMAPYTYSWAKLSGSGSVSPTNTATTNFTATVAPGVFTSGVFRCTVTDSLGGSAFVDVTASFENFGPFGV